MDAAQAQRRIAEWRAEVASHDELYYRQAKPVATDQDYDRLKRKLADLEAQFPAAARAAGEVSPTDRIGDDRAEGFQVYRHRQPMQSLDNTYSEAELREFHARLVRLIGREDLAYVVEPKIDGLAVSLTFEKGKFVRGVTRGNGVEGDDVTANVCTLHGLPHALKATKAAPIPDLIEIRGEIYLTLAEFQRINAEREEEGLEPYANPRGAGSKLCSMAPGRWNRPGPSGRSRANSTPISEPGACRRWKSSGRPTASSKPGPRSRNWTGCARASPT